MPAPDRSLDIRLRLAGVLSLAVAGVAGRGLGTLAAATPGGVVTAALAHSHLAHPALASTPLASTALAETALAAVMIAGTSAGAALATLGRHLLDEVTIASPRSIPRPRTPAHPRPA